MFLSHPYKEMITHMVEVYSGMISNNKLNISVLSEVEVDTMARIIAYGHDFGKYGYYFQQYIRCIRDKIKYLGSDDDKAHQLVSAIFVLYIGDKLLSDERLALICASCCLSHHGCLKDFSKITSEYTNPTHIGDIKRLMSFIEPYKADVALDFKDVGWEEHVLDFFHIDIKELMMKYQRVWRKFIRKNEDISLYYIHQLFYSALVEADKMSASDTIIPCEQYISHDEFVKKKIVKYGLDSSYRTEINENVISNIIRYKDSNIFAIVGPTGCGKTVTGSEAAILLRELTNMHRIFYVLPFTSIINQSYSTLKETFFEDRDSSYLFKYHSLSNERYRINNDTKKLFNMDSKAEESVSNDEYTYNQLELIMSGLHSGMVITTFNQLIESMISVKNKMLKKFNNFNNSVILIDEIQCLPLSYLPAIEKLLVEMTKILNVKIIIMTATKPFVFKDTAVNLLDDYEKYFKIQNRTEIRFINSLKKVTENDIKGEFSKDIQSKNSLMIICNTIKSSLAIYEKVKEINDNNYELMYLSTNIIPKERDRIINDVKTKIQENKKIVLVCTQLVEAGVDFDFEMVYRDLAPLPSIIQAAGRCNREGRRKQRGVIKVFNLLESMSLNRIYNYNNEIEPTIECLKEYSKEYTKSIGEEEYLEMIESFYNKMEFKYGGHDDSQELLNDIKSLKFGLESKISEFSLIKDGGKIDVFIPYGNDGVKVLEEFKNILKIDDIEVKREKMFLIKADVQSYMLSLPVKEILNNISYIEDLNGFLYVNSEVVDKVYLEKIGYKREFVVGGF